MPNVSVHLPGETGTTGLTLQLFNGNTGAVVNDPAVSLDESVNPTFYTAIVVESLTADAVFRVDVFDSNGDLFWSGWVIGAGTTAVVAYDARSPAGSSTAEELGETALTQIRELLQATTARVGVPFEADEPLYITIGDDRSESMGNSIPWELSDASGIPDMTDWTVKLFIKHGTTTTEFASGTISVASGSTRSGYIEASRAETGQLTTCSSARGHVKFYTDSGEEYVSEAALILFDVVIEPQIG